MKHLFVMVAIMTFFSCSHRDVVNVDHKRPSSLEVRFSKNEGNSFSNAVVVYGALSPGEGITAEYRYISNIHGKRGKDWFLVGQTIIREKNKVVDVIEIELSQSFDRRIFFFDASEFLASR